MYSFHLNQFKQKKEVFVIFWRVLVLHVVIFLLLLRVLRFLSVVSFWIEIQLQLLWANGQINLNIRVKLAQFILHWIKALPCPECNKCSLSISMLLYFSDFFGISVQNKLSKFIAILLSIDHESVPHLVVWNRLFSLIIIFFYLLLLGA